MRAPHFSIAGAGLAGSLAAVLLRQQGFTVEMFERRADPRGTPLGAGRSINLALTERGWSALRRAGLADQVAEQALPMFGRMIHEIDKSPFFQPYGVDAKQAIYSVHRGRLNRVLLEAAREAGATLHFEHRLSQVDFAQNIAHFATSTPGQTTAQRFSTLLGFDGAGSALRESMQAHHLLNAKLEPLGVQYKELHIPTNANGDFALDPTALHIWPRGAFMLIALPNVDRSFTATLFVPDCGPVNVALFGDSATAKLLFSRTFASALSLMPDFADDYAANPWSALNTLYCDRWHHNAQAMLLGDAAHAIVPFHGQGMNCAFEDCVSLIDALKTHSGNLASAFALVFEQRKINADAIAKMAIENYTEMSSTVADPLFQRKKKFEKLLADHYPNRFVPRYTQISFTTTAYRAAMQAGIVQAPLLQTLAQSNADPAHFDFAPWQATIEQTLELLDKIPQ
jgi:kynurenine 3-monooxygenase